MKPYQVNLLSTPTLPQPRSTSNHIHESNTNMGLCLYILLLVCLKVLIPWDHFCWLAMEWKQWQLNADLLRSKQWYRPLYHATPQSNAYLCATQLPNFIIKYIFFHADYFKLFDFTGLQACRNVWGSWGKQACDNAKAECLASTNTEDYLVYNTTWGLIGNFQFQDSGSTTKRSFLCQKPGWYNTFIIVHICKHFQIRI